MKSPRLIVAALFASALAAGPAGAAVDYFLKIDGIKGESSGKKGDHKETIELSSFTVEVAPTGGTATGKRQHKPITITKPVDKASPKLAELCAKKTVIDALELGERGKLHRLSDVVITSITKGGTADRPTETLSLNFEKIESSAAPDRAGDKPARAKQ